jgi:hypothetical protein
MNKMLLIDTTASTTVNLTIGNTLFLLKPLPQTGVNFLQSDKKT